MTKCKHKFNLAGTEENKAFVGLFVILYCEKCGLVARIKPITFRGEI